MRVLFVSANPESTMQLQLNDELRRFQHSVSGHRVKMTFLPAAQPEDIRIALKSKEFDVVHFCGHAEDEGILMRNKAGNEVLVEIDDLRALFKEQSSLKLAVLNACNTKSLATALKGIVGTVIGTSRKLDDRAARTLTKVFYATLARNESVACAYAEAMDAVKRFDPEGDLYTGHGLKSKTVLLPDKPAEDNEIEFEGRDEFNAYFYVDHIDKQIRDLTESTENSRKWSLFLFGGASAIFLILVCLLREHIDWILSMASLGFNSAEDRAAKFAEWQAFSGKPLLESIVALSALLPQLISSIKYRLFLNGKDELRSLHQLKSLVKSSTELPSHVRKRLYSIMDQGLLSSVSVATQQQEKTHDS
jgi:hypothetical protein